MEFTDKRPVFSPEVFVAEIDGNKTHTLRSFYPRIAKTLLFPDYFGKNLDALFDCLCSLEVVGRNHVVIIIHHPDVFLSKEKPEKRHAALEVLRGAEQPENRSDGVQFQVICLR
jgi:RNAse (barnase) inhibitor barstar